MGVARLKQIAPLWLSTRNIKNNWLNKLEVRRNYVVADNLSDKKNTPWLMLPPQVDEKTGEKQDCFYSLCESETIRLNREKSLKVPDTARCIGSAKGSWLSFADRKDGKLYLSNPFLNDVVELPCLGKLPQVVGVKRDPETSCILNFNVSYPDYHYQVWDDRDTDWIDETKPEEMADRMISQVALSNEDPRYDDCVAMAVQGEMSRLAYCHIGRICTRPMTDAIWYGLQEDYLVTGIMNQIVYSCKTQLFYSICSEGIRAFDVERERGQRSKMVSLFRMENISILRREGEPKWLEKLDCLTQYYLLTLSNGDLWLIVRHLLRSETVHFEVFRVAFPGRLERLTYLEDRAIFIGSNQSFSIKAPHFPNVSPNCIYFTDDVTRVNYSGHDMGIFNMHTGDITPFYPYQDEEEEKKVPMTMPLIWVAPQLDFSNS